MLLNILQCFSPFDNESCPQDVSNAKTEKLCFSCEPSAKGRVFLLESFDIGCPRAGLLFGSSAAPIKPFFVHFTNFTASV